MTAAPSGGLTYSSKQNQCPICGRTKDGDCRISADGQEVICHHPKDLRPGFDVVNGYAFTGNTRDGRAGHFTIDKPKNSRGPAMVLPFLSPRIQASCPSPEPLPIKGSIALAPCEPVEFDASNRKWRYSPTQGTKREDSERGKSFRPLHLVGNKWEAGNGPNQWPLYREDEAIKAAGFWVIETEGEKCADIVRAGGRVAISQPGHAHKVEQIVPRYRRLLDAGVLGLVYLEDNDEQGQQRSQQSAQAAAAAGLPLLVLPAVEVWPRLPEKGSIDDASGTAAERVAALEAAIPEAIRRQQHETAKQAAADPGLIELAVDEQQGATDSDQGGDAARSAGAEHLAAANSVVDLAQILHPWLADRLKARAASFPLHPLWLLAPALTATSSIVGTRARVVVKRGWSEPLIFWTGNVVEASTLKTSAAGVFQGPLTRIEIAARTAHREAVKARQEDDPELPPPVRRLAMDATYEAVAVLAAAPQNHGIASFQDELSGWFANLRRECSATARSGWLQLWSGQPIVIDRKTSEPVFAPRCAVSLFGNVQPSKLAQMMAATGDGAESAGDGLWSRFLWVRPPHTPFQYVTDDADISDDIRVLLERLNTTPSGTDEELPLAICLCQQAIAAMAPWWETWAQEQHCSAPGRAAFLGKLRGYSVRLTGLLALLDVACEAVPSSVQLTGMPQLRSTANNWQMDATADHADRAIRLSIFFLDQFDALQAEIGHGDLPAEVAQLISRARDSGQPVSIRQVVRWKLPHRDATSDQALTWLREVVVGRYGMGQLDRGQRKDQIVWQLS